jgi:hypothetical protein
MRILLAICSEATCIYFFQPAKSFAFAFFGIVMNYVLAWFKVRFFQSTITITIPWFPSVSYYEKWSIFMCLNFFPYCFFLESISLAGTHTYLEVMLWYWLIEFALSVHDSRIEPLGRIYLIFEDFPGSRKNIAS